MAETFLSAVEFSQSKLGIPNLKLKDKQLEALKACYNIKDCLAILLTGYGKSLIYQLLPYLMQCRHGRSEPMIVIVVCPLNSIMQDQVTGLAERGIMACFLDIKGTSGTTYELSANVNQESDAEESKASDSDEACQEVSVFTEKTVSLTSLKRGDYKLIYAHPETLISNSLVWRMLRSKKYRDEVSCIAVDEVHLVTDWGDKFRTDFNKLSELNALFSKAVHLVVTATLAPPMITNLVNNLQLDDPLIIRVNPDRQNIFIGKEKRLPNTNKFAKFDDLIEPLYAELKEKKGTFPVTIVYVDGLECLGYCYQYLALNLGDEGYLPHKDLVPENCIFAQYHKSYTKRMKSLIVHELRKPDPILRLILATVALGMGLDAPSVKRVIHFRPPTSLEKYAQEFGRAGRNGQEASATLYFNMSDIAPNRPGITTDMRNFCLNTSSCLREQLLKYFGSEKHFNGPTHKCCSNCAKLHATEND